jgi:hypothetical protein
MTDTNPTPAPEASPAEAEAVTELWTYGGLTSASRKDQRAIWYDADRHRWLFAPVKGTHPVVGGLYAVEATRYTDDDGKARLNRHTVPQFTGLAEDRAWRAQLEASAHAVELEIASGQMERRAARDGAIAHALEPVERLAAGMSYSQRAALVDLITRRIYRA